MEAENYIRPTVNLNGTDYESLLNQWKTVMEAANRLNEALAEATPHGRDYQINSDPAYDLELAREKVLDMRMRVTTLKIEATAVALHILNQRK